MNDTDITPKIGSLVEIKYTGGIRGQEPRDIRQDEPLTVLLGSLKLPRGIEKAIMTMHVGEIKTFEIPPEEGFGIHQDKYTEWFPRSLIKDGYSLTKGDFYIWINPKTNEPMPAIITEAKDDVLLLDFNHPYAGQTLLYSIELLSCK